MKVILQLQTHTTHRQKINIALTRLSLILTVSLALTALTVHGQSDTLVNISVLCIPSPDTLDGDTVYAFVDKMPEYPGGNEKMLAFILKNLKYPDSQEDHFQGSIYVSFIIDTSGQVRNACIYKRGFKGGLTPVENEALRVVNSMPKWSVGQQNEKKVSVRIPLPIKFILKE